MKRLFSGLLALSFFLGAASPAFAGALPPVRVVKTGGGYTVECQSFGMDMRGQLVRSCLLAKTSELSITATEKIFCAAKYATAFRGDGRLEYCTLAQDTTLRRTAKDTVTCKAGGRVVFRENGSVESAMLKDTIELPYAKNVAISCRGGFPIAFRADGNVANCVLDSETAFDSGKKKKLKTACKAGGLIAFDEDGKFNGCYPPPPPKPDKTKDASPQKSNPDRTDPALQGGQTP